MCQILKKTSLEDIRKILGECKIGSPEGYVPPEGWSAVGYSPSHVTLYHKKKGWDIKEREGWEQKTAYPRERIDGC